MPKCKACGDDVDDLVSIAVDGKKTRLCEPCAEEAAAHDAIAQESEAAVQQIMGFKGRR